MKTTVIVEENQRTEDDLNLSAIEFVKTILDVNEPTFFIQNLNIMFRAFYLYHENIEQTKRCDVIYSLESMRAALEWINGMESHEFEIYQYNENTLDALNSALAILNEADGAELCLKSLEMMFEAFYLRDDDASDHKTRLNVHTTLKTMNKAIEHIKYLDREGLEKNKNSLCFILGNGKTNKPFLS